MYAVTFPFLGLISLAACCASAAGQGPPKEGPPKQDPPKEARRAFEKGAAAAKSKRADEARRDFEQAVNLFPGYAEAWYELGMLRIGHKEPDAARNAFRAAIQADPTYVEPYLPLVALELANRHWKELVDLTDALLRLNAIDFPQAWLMNAVGNFNNRNPQAAEKSAREAERLDPRQKFPEIWRLLGLILAQRGDFAGEADQFREYLKLVPSGPESEAIRAKLAEATKRAGNIPLAEPGATFRSETSLAVVRFQVRPNKGDPVRNLAPADIEIREDGVAQKIAVFEGGSVNPHTVPVEISLLFDHSGSVERIAALTPRVFRDNFLDEFPNASIAIYGFSDNLVRLSRPTRDAAALKKALDAVASIPQRATPLFGSIADTVRDASTTGANVVRMLIIFSDGESEWPGDESRAEEASRVAEASGTTLFPVMLDKSGASAMGAAGSIHDFLSLASATGGRTFQGFMGTDVLPNILKSLAREIRSDYIAGFYVPSSGDQKRHHIEVVLRSKDRGRLYGGSRTLVH